MKDMNRMIKTTKEVDVEYKDWRGEMQMCRTHEMTDEKTWEDFRLKWKTPRSVDFTFLNNCVG
jgi:hypothetical protein